MGKIKPNPVLTPDEEAALRVLIKSEHVQNWARGELAAYGIRPDSPEGKKFISEHTRTHALKIIGKA